MTTNRRSNHIYIYQTSKHGKSNYTMWSFVQTVISKIHLFDESSVTHVAMSGARRKNCLSKFIYRTGLKASRTLPSSHSRGKFVRFIKNFNQVSSCRAKTLSRYPSSNFLLFNRGNLYWGFSYAA